MLTRAEIEAKLDCSWEFHTLLNRLIDINEVPAEKVCEGLCTPGMLSKIRKGERIPNKLMRDRLVARLGVADERNESFLNYEDYSKWENRQDILKAIDDEQFDKAEKLLEEFTKSADFKGKIEQQFYYTMLAQIYLCKNIHLDMIADLYEKALKLTVPEIDEKNLKDLLLAPQEINLVMEYVKYKSKDATIVHFEKVVEYINNSNMDQQTKAKIYPKAVYYLCCVWRDINSMDYNKMLRACNLAIEILRSSQKLYYFWELLEMRAWIYDRVLEKEDLDSKKRGVFENLSVQNDEWKQAIEYVFHRCNLQAKMRNDIYMYYQAEMYCINDVIRIRREMLGMTKKELCEGICDEQTIGRLENHKSKVQLAIARELLIKLGLSGEFQRSDIITSNLECLKLEEELSRAANNHQLEEENRIVNQLEKALLMDLLPNKQFIKYSRTILSLRKSEITKEQAVDQMKAALEYTIPYSYIKNAKELYLTNVEIQCIYGMAKNSGKKTLNEYYSLLKCMYENYEKKGKIREHLMMYNLIMSSVASLLGNLGEFDESNNIARVLLHMDAKVGRLATVEFCLYNILWNERERAKTAEKVQSVEDERRILETCKALTGILRQSYYVEFYKRKLELLDNNAPF